MTSPALAIDSPVRDPFLAPDSLMRQAGIDTAQELLAFMRRPEAQRLHPVPFFLVYVLTGLGFRIAQFAGGDLHASITPKTPWSNPGWRGEPDAVEGFLGILAPHLVGEGGDAPCAGCGTAPVPTAGLYCEPCYLGD